MMNYRTTILLISLIIIRINSYCQVDSTKFNFIKSVSTDLIKYYVFKDIGKKMSDSILLKFKNEGYDSTLNIDEFAFEVTKDLRKISNDRHISFWPEDPKTYNEIIQAKIKSRRNFFNKDIPNMLFRGYINRRTARALSKDNYEYGDIKILPGNIGYVEVFQLMSVADKRKKNNNNRIKFSKVIKFLSNTDKIIIDFRNNQGGRLTQASYFCSFFISEPNTDSYFLTSIRRDGSLESIYDKDTLICSTKKYLLTKNKCSQKYINKEIYLLTSNRTFSSAELIAYKLQKCSNTIIVGEKTIGGGNGYEFVHYDKNYTGIIPNSQAYDESNQNYSIEGIGIKPNIETSEDSAMIIAYNNSSNNFGSNKKIVYYNKKANKEKKSKFIKINNLDYIGSYERYTVVEKNGILYLIIDDLKQVKLIPISKDNFEATGFNRIFFERDLDNKIIRIQIELKNRCEKFKKK